MMIRSRAPLRLVLAGGGTDLSPYCDMYGGYVLNATIDRYAYTLINLDDDGRVSFCASDLNVEESFEISQEFELDGALMLLKATYMYMMQHYNRGVRVPLQMTTFCDAPAGSGLGSSSTLVVTMVKALDELLNLRLDEYQVATSAFYIERVLCKLSGGRQDQYAATFGGFNGMEFNADDQHIINPLRLKNNVVSELEASLVLFYLGVSRESANIIDAQTVSIKSSTNTIELFHEMKEEAVRMKNCLLKADFDGFVGCMKRGWDSKKKTASSVSNPLIERVYEEVMEAGALAGKVSGAGGGGFMWFFVDPGNRMRVIRVLEEFNGTVGNVHFTNNGVESWQV